MCECGTVSLRCTPVAGESQPRSSSAVVSLEMDVVDNRIDNLEELNHNPDTAAVARAVLGEMTESDWSGLRRLYLGAKRDYTETTDLDQIEGSVSRRSHRPSHHWWAITTSSRMPLRSRFH